MLDARGEGYHHVMLRIPYDAGVERFSRRGHEIAFSGAMPSGERFCLIDTRDAGCGYIELMEISPAMDQSLGLMHKAHLAWDGVADPIRSMAALAYQS